MTVLYLKIFIIAFIFSVILVPIIRYISIKFGHYDVPNEIKTHKGMVPLSGGIAVFISFSITLIIARFFTSFPTGTLREIRYILLTSVFILLIGVIDDIKKPLGIEAKKKFFIEILFAIFLLTRGFEIAFIKPDYIAWVLTILWIVGITNAFNIIDIMDGLSSSQVFIACITFFFITLPSESIYVNFLSISLAGAILGFIPYNLSNKYKIFLGDSGSLFCGFILSVISLGAKYSEQNPLGVYVPILILSVPIFDTLYVSYIRIRKKISPFTGTKDHFALRFEAMGWSRKKIVFLSALYSLIISILSYVITQVNFFYSILIYFAVLIFLIKISNYISKVKVN